jgi:hypothetical protein
LIEQFVFPVGDVSVLVECTCGAGAILDVSKDEGRFSACPGCHNPLGKLPDGSNVIDHYLHSLRQLKHLNISLVVRKNAQPPAVHNATDFGKGDR